MNKQVLIEYLRVPIISFLTVIAIFSGIAIDVSRSAGAATETEPAKTEPYERIPFTNKPVTPGDPESYIGTYGQCPFYENAGEKGCYPPSDIVCNADWSKCEPKKESEPTNVPTNDSRSTPSKEEQPSGCFSSK